jgi:hypothetical protein
MSNLPKTTNQFNTNSYYNSYYKTTLPVSGQEYDATLTYFLKKTNGNRSAAEALTATILSIAENRGLSVIGIIEELKKYKDDNSYKAAILSLINSDRRPTSKLGYSVVPGINPTIARNISK